MVKTEYVIGRDHRISYWNELGGESKKDVKVDSMTVVLANDRIDKRLLSFHWCDTSSVSGNSRQIT